MKLQQQKYVVSLIVQKGARRCIRSNDYEMLALISVTADLQSVVLAIFLQKRAMDIVGLKH